MYVRRRSVRRWAFVFWVWLLPSIFLRLFFRYQSALTWKDNARAGFWCLGQLLFSAAAADRKRIALPYQSRYTMRALAVSYGDISILTRSPIVRRINLLRIFPEMCARTRWSFASATRNMVPGRTDMIVPSIVIAFSEFINIYFLSLISDCWSLISTGIPAALNYQLSTIDFEP